MTVPGQHFFNHQQLFKLIYVGWNTLFPSQFLPPFIECLVHDSANSKLLIYHSVQFSSVVQLCPTLCNPMNRSTPGLPVHHQLPEFTQTHVHWVSDAIQPSHLLSSPSPPAPNPSQHQSLFQWVNSSHESKYWSFSFSIIPSNEHPGLISSRMEWLDLLAVQGTLKNLLQYHSSKISILWHSAFSLITGI